MIINKTYNKSVTSLDPGEVVVERYNGSNAKFAIFKTIKLAANTIISFSELKDFKYIDWGDGSDVTLGPSAAAASHTYATADGEKEFIIVVYGIDDFGGDEIGNRNIFTTDIVAEAYFGEGVKIWKSGRVTQGFYNGSSLITVKNISQITTQCFYNQINLQNVTFNIDCDTIGLSAFENTCQTQEEKCLVIPKYIQNISFNAFKDSGFKVCIEYEKGKNPSGYSDNGNTYYYYSETEPTDADNYWHYVNGEPTIWGEAYFEIGEEVFNFTRGQIWEDFEHIDFSTILEDDAVIYRGSTLYADENKSVQVKPSDEITPQIYYA